MWWEWAVPQVAAARLGLPALATLLLANPVWDSAVAMPKRTRGVGDDENVVEGSDAGESDAGVSGTRDGNVVNSDVVAPGSHFRRVVAAQAATDSIVNEGNGGSCIGSSGDGSGDNPRF